MFGITAKLCVSCGKPHLLCLNTSNLPDFSKFQYSFFCPVTNELVDLRDNGEFWRPVRLKPGGAVKLEEQPREVQQISPPNFLQGYTHSIVLRRS